MLKSSQKSYFSIQLPWSQTGLSDGQSEFFEHSLQTKPKQLPLKQIEKPNEGLVSSIEEYKKTLEKVASEETSFIRKIQDPKNPKKP